MHFFRCLVLCLALVCCSVLCEGKVQWNGEHVAWLKWPAALSRAKQERKPMMLVSHRSWCAACKDLEPRFAASPEIELLSEYFVMVSIAEDDEEPPEKQYHGQGLYTPRIVFADSTGKVLDIVNEVQPDPQHLHFFGEVPAIVEAMKTALRQASGFTTFRGL